MAADTVQVKGLDELKRKLADVPKTLRKRVLRTALAAGAREVRDVAKRNAPVLTLGTSMKAPYRKPGTVRGFSMNVALTEFAFFEQPDETLRAVLRMDFKNIK